MYECSECMNLAAPDTVHQKNYFVVCSAVAMSHTVANSTLYKDKNEDVNENKHYTEELIQWWGLHLEDTPSHFLHCKCILSITGTSNRAPIGHSFFSKVDMDHLWSYIKFLGGAKYVNHVLNIHTELLIYEARECPKC